MTDLNNLQMLQHNVVDSDSPGLSSWTGQVGELSGEGVLFAVRDTTGAGQFEVRMHDGVTGGGIALMRADGKNNAGAAFLNQDLSNITDVGRTAIEDLTKPIRDEAIVAKDESVAAKDLAETYRDEAQTAMTTAQSAATTAGAHEQTAEEAKDAAKSSADAAKASEANAKTSETIASDSRTAASQSASAAASSASKALVSEKAAGSSEVAAEASAGKAKASEDAAALSAEDARKWAVGTIQERPEGSAEYWAKSINPSEFAQKDLSNVPTNYDFIVDSGSSTEGNQTAFYVQFKSGLLIQWGQYTSTNGVTTITFPKPYLDTSYIVSHGFNTDSTGSIWVASMSAFNKTITSWQNHEGAAMLKDWIAIGQGATE